MKSICAALIAVLGFSLYFIGCGSGGGSSSSGASVQGVGMYEPSTVSPQGAINSSGNAVAVWSQDDGTRYNIYSNLYTASTATWGTPVLIETENAGGAYNPQVAIDSFGNAIAVWEQDDGTRYNIWSNSYSASTGSWEAATLIETDNAGNALAPQVAIDSSGNAVAVWKQSDGTRYNVWSNRYTASTGNWGTAMLIETDNGAADNPQVVITSSGNAVAVWKQFDGTCYNIWSNNYNASTGSWGAASLIETDNAGDVQYPQVVIDSNGNAVAVWRQSDGTRFNVYSNRYTASTGSWGTATLIEANNAGDAQYPQIAINSSGNVVAVWRQIGGVLISIQTATPPQ